MSKKGQWWHARQEDCFPPAGPACEETYGSRVKMFLTLGALLPKGAVAPLLTIGETFAHADNLDGGPCLAGRGLDAAFVERFGRGPMRQTSKLGEHRAQYTSPLHSRFIDVFRAGVFRGAIAYDLTAPRPEGAPRLGRSLRDLVGFLGWLHALGIDRHQQGLDTRTVALDDFDDGPPDIVGTREVSKREIRTPESAGVRPTCRITGTPPADDDA